MLPLDLLGYTASMRRGASRSFSRIDRRYLERMGILSSRGHFCRVISCGPCVIGALIRAVVRFSPIFRATRSSNLSPMNFRAIRRCGGHSILDRLTYPMKTLGLQPASSTSPYLAGTDQRQQLVPQWDA